MKVEELITFCALKGNLDEHKQQLNPAFWRVRLYYANKMITFVYHKDPENDKLTFINGRISTSEGKLGTMCSAIHGFKHLMKTLT